MALTIDLSAVSIVGGKFSASGNVKLGNTTIASQNISGTRISSEDNDVLTFSDGAIALKTGKGADWDLVNSSLAAGTASVTKATFGGASTVAVGTSVTDVIMSSGADVVSLGGSAAVVNLGTGNDTVQGNANKATITLGSGTDIVSLTGEATIADYKYKEDVIISSDTLTLSDAGILDDGSKVTLDISSGMVNSAYYAKVADKADAKNFRYFATAQANSGIVTADFSAVAKAGDSLTVDMSGASKANISVGKANNVDVILNGDPASGVDVVTLANAGALVGISNFAMTGDTIDQLNLSGATLQNISLGHNNTEVTLGYGKDSVTFLGNGDSVGVVAINDNKIAFNVGEAKELSDGVANQFYGMAGTTLNVSGDHYLTANKANYKDINIVALSEDGQSVKGLKIEGSATADTINVSTSKEGAEVNGGAGADAITLAGTGNTASDVLWFGKGNGAGVADEVDGFAYGKAAGADVLYLYDTASLSGIKLANHAANYISVTASDKGIANVGVVAASDEEKSDILKVRLSDGKDYKVLTGLSDGAGAIALNAADQGELNFFAFADGGSSVNVTGEEGTGIYLDTAATDLYSGKLSAVVADSEMKGNMTVFGVAEATLGAGTNDFWARNVASKVELAQGAGKDTIRFQSESKKVTVANFEAIKEGVANDAVWLTDAGDANSIVAGYKFSANNGDVAITAANNTGAVLALNGVSEKFAIKTGAEGANSYTALVTAGGDGMFATDIDIYAGMDRIVADSTVSGTEIKVGLGATNSALIAGSYGAPLVDNKVKDFDGSDSTATMIVMGRSDGSSRIAGGKTSNLLFGGSSATDTLVGNSTALNTFWWGSSEGSDKIEGAHSGDILYLWNVKSADLANVVVTATDANSKLAIGNEVLSIDDSGALQSGSITVVTSDFVNYVYSSESKSFVQKA